MQSASTRRFLDVEELASRRAVLAGLVEAESMPRLLEIIARAPRAIAYRIEFSWDSSRRPKMNGRVDGALPLVCQRCLDVFDWQFDMKFESLVIGDKHEDSDGRDAVVCPGGRLSLEPVIEDELLLSVPNAPVHVHGTCTAPRIWNANARQESPRKNPFSALHALRSGRGHEQSN